MFSRVPLFLLEAYDKGYVTADRMMKYKGVLHRVFVIEIYPLLFFIF